MRYPRRPADKSTYTYRLLLLCLGVMTLGALKPFKWGRPTTGLGWFLLTAWLISYLAMVLVVFVQIRRHMQETEIFDNAAVRDLRRERDQRQAEYQRFQPDYEQARTYYYADPSNEALRERYEQISAHQESLRKEIRVLNDLLTTLGKNEQQATV